MDHQRDSGRLDWRQRCSTGAAALLLALTTAFVPQAGSAQQLTGTISGTAYDSAGAVIPNAKVVLKNEASGDVRTTATEASTQLCRQTPPRSAPRSTRR